MVKGWARVGWSLGGGNVVGSDAGGNLSSDMGQLVGLTSATAEVKSDSRDPTAPAMMGDRPGYLNLCEVELGGWRGVA
jgi:hypothetical protein